MTKGKGKAGEEPELPTVAHKEVDGESPVKEPDEKPFELKNLNFSVPKGSFIAIVGRIGCGKVSAIAAVILQDAECGAELCAPGTDWRDAKDEGRGK